YAARDLPGGEQARDGGLAVVVDAQAAVLVVQDGVGQDRLVQRVDARGAVTAQHRGDHLSGDFGIDGGRVEMHGRAPVGRDQPAALVALADDGRGDRVARRELVAEAVSGGVAEGGAVAAARLRDREALQRRRPGAAGGVVLERVVVAHLGAQTAGERRRLAGRAGLVRGQDARVVGLLVAAPAG